MVVKYTYIYVLYIYIYVLYIYKNQETSIYIYIYIYRLHGNVSMFLGFLFRNNGVCFVGLYCR